MDDFGTGGTVDGGTSAVPDPALTTCLALLGALLQRPGYAFGAGEVRENLRTVHALAATVEAARLLFVEELRTRPGIVPGAVAGTAAARRFLVEALHLGTARADRDLAAARATRTGVLPALGRALARGEVSREHVDVAVRVLAALPGTLKDKTLPGAGTDAHGRPVDLTGAQYIDELLTAEARQAPPAGVERLGRRIRHVLDPDRADRYDADADQRRSATLTTDFAGMTLLHAALDPASGLQVRGATARRAAPHPAGTATDEHGRPCTVTDERTAGQRQADALVDLVLAGAAALGVIPAGQEPIAPTDPAAPGSPGHGWQAAAGIEVSIVATLPQLLAAYVTDPAEVAAAGLARSTLSGPTGTYPGATLDPRILARLACDSPLRSIVVDPHGAVLHHGRSRRLATTAQRRALAIRDGGCVVPGCHAPPEWTDVHHLTPWEQGGGTDLHNLLLLCRRHHTAHHAGAYPIRMRHSIPWVRMPAWADPARPWLRNTSHRHQEVADQVAQVLLIDPEAA